MDSITIRGIVESDWFREIVKDDVILYRAAELYRRDELFSTDPMGWIKLVIISYHESTARLQKDLLHAVEIDVRPFVFPAGAVWSDCKTCPNRKKPWWKFGK